ncbi:MAG: DNA repair protein RecO [Spirochaetaceae bacterium 4572_59]|nr:MAG: DNA repair protein RecO [Spirochaetaceae bacterium 4572_59]
MNRLHKDRYIPLKSSALGDNHRSVLMLTASQGLIYAAAFGAAGKKGRLRPLIQPFSLCEGELYFDPVKKLWRLKDGSCIDVHDSFHSSLKKYYAATFWCELILKTHGGAGSEGFFLLTANLLDQLDLSKPVAVPSVLIQSLWTFLDLEGIQPDLTSCARCGRRAPENRTICYDAGGHVVCSHCRIGTMPLLSAKGRSYLLGQEKEGISEASDIDSLFTYLLMILRGLTGSSFEIDGLEIITS